MKTIKIKYVDMEESFIPDDFVIHNILKKKYNVILSDNPDYLIYSNFGDEHYKYNCIKIFYSGEVSLPNFNECDYGIGFIENKFDDRYCSLPNFFAYEYYIKRFKKIKLDRRTNKKKKFCSFVVKNDFSNTRVDFFKELSKYKKVDSGGECLNNIGYIIDDKMKFIKDYKFNICFENCSSKNYMTEKIIEAFAAGTVPIYWGDPLITKYVNPNAFINIKSKDDFENAIELIKKIDNDDELYNEYLSFNPFSDYDGLIKKRRKLKKFIYHIFDQELEEARRIPNGPFYKIYNSTKVRRIRYLNVFKRMPSVRIYVFFKHLIFGDRNEK